MNDELDEYLSEIASQLSVEPAKEREILREIRAHLEEALSELQEGGLDRQESLAQAIANFGEAREVGRMLGRLHNNPDWVQVGLAILPGLTALGISIGVPWSLFGTSFARTLAQGGLITVCTVLIVAGLVRERQIAVWSFPAWGIILFPLSGILLFISWWVHLPFIDEASPVWHTGPLIVLVGLLAGIGSFAVVRVYRQHWIPVPRPVWVLVASVILVTLGGGITSTIADQSADKWLALSVMVPSTLLRMGVILLPVAIGLLLARRHGLLAGLIVVAAEFVLVDEIFDPAYALGIWTSSSTIVTLVSVIPAVFFLVVSPMWVLLSRSTGGRVAGLLVPPFVALVSGEIIGGSVRPYYMDDWLWLVRAIGSMQFLMALALAVVIYHWLGGQRRVTNVRDERGALTDEAVRLAGGNVLSTGKGIESPARQPIGQGSTGDFEGDGRPFLVAEWPRG
jgi:hypothetical protein